MRVLRRSLLAASVAAATLTALPVGAGAQSTITLSSSRGFAFPILAYTTGALRSEIISAEFENVHEFYLAGAKYDLTELGTVEDPLLLFNARMIVMPSIVIGDFIVRRELYVPPLGGQWVRYIDVAQNAASASRSIDPEYAGVFACCSSSRFTSSGDTGLDTSDLWWVIADTDSTGDTEKFIVLQGIDNVLGGLATASYTRVSSREVYTYTWRNVEVPADGRAVFMTYIGQSNTADGARLDAQDLTDPTSDMVAMFDLDPYVDDVKNFLLRTDADAPEVRWTAPRVADEGEGFTIGVDIRDPNETGAAITWKWDLDADGEFGEAAPDSIEESLNNVSVLTVPPGTTDGPGAYTVTVQATIGAGSADPHTSTRTYRVWIQNVAPEITSDASLQAVLGAQYQYLIEVDDPGAENDAINFQLAEGPDSAGIEKIGYNQGLLRWTPGTNDITGVGESILFQLIINDGDGGEDTQTWELLVEDNRPPMAPVPVYPVGKVGTTDTQPRLAVQNATDFDVDDQLVYFFEIDTVDTFEGVNLRQSGPVAELPGVTYWIVEPELEVGRYYWRARASDGSLTSDWRDEEFWVLREPFDAGITFPDAGLAPIEDDGDCSVGHRPGGGLALAGFVALGLVLGVRRRRRS